MHQSPGSDVPNVPWPWLHEKDYMQDGRKSVTGNPESRQPSRAVSTVSGTAVNAANASPAGQPTSTPDLNGTFSDTVTPMSNLVENLVAYAASTAFLPDDRSTRRHHWESVSLQLAELWGYGSVFNPRRALYELVQVYLDKFNVLWPLLNHEQLDPDTHHPILFLVVTSVGAMFGHPTQREFGSLMHQRLRRLLCASLYDLEGPGDGMVWLAQARLLTQIASLYFGQHQSFSYAQHLSAITIAQLRRMDFFREPIPDRVIRSSDLTPEEELARFHDFECRRRIAFGILRTDVYTSILLNTRPLLTSEEMKLTFIRPDSLWLNTGNLTPEQQLAAYRMEESRCLQLPLSDLVRIFFERNEPNPYLGPVGHELVLFGLQEAVWRFSQDPELFPRLTGRCLADTDITYTSRILANSDSTNGHVIPGSTGFWQRRMDDLHGDRLRLVRALDTWSSAVDLAISRGAYTLHRDTLMSSMLLYRLSKLRLCAPLEELHHISYRSAHPKTVDLHVHRKIEAWLESKFAVEAAHLAWDVKMLIETNLQRPAEERARFNYLSFCSLHHAAVVLWTVIAIHNNDPMASTFDIPNHSIDLFLRDCKNLFSRLSPLGSNSFEAAAERLQRYRFPRLDPTMK
ncbi:hypothetical protein M409DRAFT_65531 [Zasmidium cellare ATCC 36951]|uniref:Xylanolytic transcriptional activator regulatory domain-containing protein n=1 Tax=Zasmidium cellare ATCC 36951 TaxID=1080233 RepID=A0A6A6CNN0_ZASCE|nr:uncharacterized protein M409DRAFT_65531 [Zasmidium cellare ATCC 36951]KAF2168651.1 hypothetical protein M409DRAFT_65531 [Zasmidium cellare ATCC 36951]